MTTRFCVLLDGPVTHDARVQRTVRTLSRRGSVLLVTTGGSGDDSRLFGETVEVRTVPRPTLSGVRKWLLLHRHHDHLAEEALATGRAFDVVWANDYPTLWPAHRVARETGAKLVYDSHEIWLETVNQFFPMDAPFPRSLAFRGIVGLCRAIGRRVERDLVARTDLFLTANRSYADHLRKRYGASEVGVVLNCPESAPLVRSDRIHRALGFPYSDKVVLYQGVMNAGRGLAELVESARGFPDGVRLVLLGHGPLEGPLRRQVEGAGLGERVHLPGIVPRAELHDWTSSADLGVLVLDPVNLSKRLSLANKIFEYMAAGIPILATDMPENRRILESVDCGWLVAGREPNALSTKIVEILGDGAERRRRGANGRRAVEKRYRWEVEEKRLIEYLDGVVAKEG